MIHSDLCVCVCAYVRACMHTCMRVCLMVCNMFICIYCNEHEMVFLLWNLTLMFHLRAGTSCGDSRAQDPKRPRGRRALLLRARDEAWVVVVCERDDAAGAASDVGSAGRW